VATITSGKRPFPNAEKESRGFTIPIVGASSIMGFTNQYLYNTPIIIIGRVGTHGIIQRFQTECWPSDNTLIITSEYYEFIYQILKSINYKNLNRGSTQPLITQTDINATVIIIPDIDSLKKFEICINTVMKCSWYLKQQSRTLAAIRDALLPKLMAGEIEIYDENDTIRKEIKQCNI
jgi:type I restriction enzyme S subunit